MWCDHSVQEWWTPAAPLRHTATCPDAPVALDQPAPEPEPDPEPSTGGLVEFGPGIRVWDGSPAAFLVRPGVNFRGDR